jgi:hypothetical protein
MLALCYIFVRILVRATILLLKAIAILIALDS